MHVEYACLCSLNYPTLTWRCCLIYNLITFSFWNSCMTHCHHCQKLTYYRCSWLKKWQKMFNNLIDKLLKCNNRYGQTITNKMLMEDCSFEHQQISPPDIICLCINFSVQSNFSSVHFNIRYADRVYIIYNHRIKNEKP